MEDIKKCQHCKKQAEFLWNIWFDEGKKLVCRECYVVIKRTKEKSNGHDLIGPLES